MTMKNLHTWLLATALAIVCTTAFFNRPPRERWKLESPVYAQVPGGTCVLEGVQSASGFNFPLTCEDRGRFTAAPLTGGPCTAPTLPGVTFFTKLPDGTCLPMVIIPSQGLIASLPPTLTAPTSGTMTVSQLGVVLRSLVDQQNKKP